MTGLAGQHRFRPLAAVLLIAALFLTACGQDGPPPGGTSGGGESQGGGEPVEAYTFALIMPMTGGNAGYGMDQVNSLLMGVEDVNADGGVDGIPLRVITEDSQANPQLGVAAFRKVTSVDKVPLVVTAWSAVVKAIAPFAEETGVLTLSIGANDPKIKELRPWTRTTFPLADVSTVALAQYTYDKLGKRRAAIVYVNNDTGVYAAEVYKEVFTQAGGEVVFMEGVPQDATDFSAVISKIKNANPDVVHMQLLSEGTQHFPGQYRAAGGTALLTSYESAQDPVMIEKSPEAAEGIIFTTSSPDPSTSEPVTEFLDRWRARFGRDPNGPTYCTYLYDAPFLIREIIRYINAQGWEYNGENVRRAFESLGTVVLPLNGPSEFREDGSVVKPIFINEIRDGKFEWIDTVEIGEPGL